MTFQFTGESAYIVLLSKSRQVLPFSVPLSLSVSWYPHLPQMLLPRKANQACQSRALAKSKVVIRQDSFRSS